MKSIVPESALLCCPATQKGQCELAKVDVSLAGGRGAVGPPGATTTRRLLVSEWAEIWVNRVHGRVVIAQTSLQAALLSNQAHPPLIYREDVETIRFSYQ